MRVLKHACTLSRPDKQNLKLTKEQREILIGIILGDAHMESQNSGKTYRVKFAQSGDVAHKAYLDHLYHVFKA